jgi:hypothetical protein
MAFSPLRCCFISARSSRLEALESVVKVSRASVGGDGMRWHP